MQQRLLAVIASMLCSVLLHAQINVENVLNMGRRAIGIDDYLTAIQHFNRVTEARPADYRAFYYRAYAKFSLEDFQGAADDCTKAITNNPYITEVYQLRGLCRIHLNDFQGAINDYDVVTRNLPDEQGAYYNRALCKLELKQLRAADGDMDIILQKWKKFYKAYLIKAQIKFEENDTTAAMVWVDSLLSVDPLEHNAWSIKGKHALSRNDYTTADTCLSHAIRLAPKEHTNYIARAQARHGLNMFGSALQDYDATIALIPEHFVAHYNRGLLRALVGDDNRAIEDFDFVIAVEPDNTLAIYNRALLREQTGNYLGAIEDYTKLLELHPGFMEGFVARARCRRKVGNLQGAIADETVAARARLDLTFKPGKRKPIKKVRKSSDHHLERYQQLVEEEVDTTQRYVRQLLGKVQNRPVACEILPMFEFYLGAQPQENSHLPKQYLPEIERINQHLGLIYPMNIGTLSHNTPQHTDVGMISASEVIADTTTTRLPETLFVRSVHAYNQQNYLLSLHDIQETIRQQTENYIYFVHRANIYMKLSMSSVAQTSTLTASGQAEDYSRLALADIEVAMQLMPNSALLLYNRGCLYYSCGEWEKAIEDFTQATELDDKLPQAYYNRGVIHMKKEMYTTSLGDLSRAGELGLHQAYNLIRQAAKEIQTKQTTKGK